MPIFSAATGRFVSIYREGKGSYYKVDFIWDKRPPRKRSLVYIEGDVA